MQMSTSSLALSTLDGSYLASVAKWRYCRRTGTIRDVEEEAIRIVEMSVAMADMEMSPVDEALDTLITIRLAVVGQEAIT
jgi:hypothetical protein